MHFVGRVTRGLVSKGSKSEREAVLLEMPTGRFVLRRKGGNAFSDSQLEELVGCEIEAEGTLVGQTLIASAVSIRRACPKSPDLSSHRAEEED